MPILFLFLFLLSAVLFPFLGNVNLDILYLKNILFFAAMITAAIIWNVAYYRGVQSEKVHEFELIIMFQPLLTILLAAFVYPSERNIHIFIAALIAAISLIFAHFHKKHLEFTSGAKSLVIAVVFMSIELILDKELLNFFSPVAFYFYRTGFLFLFFYFFFRPQIYKVATKNLALVLASATLGTTQMVTKFYGFQELGVVYTSLILILSPLLVYVGSVIILHEKLRPRLILSAIVILGCIVYATVLGK